MLMLHDQNQSKPAHTKRRSSELSMIRDFSFFSIIICGFCDVSRFMMSEDEGEGRKMTSVSAVHNMNQVDEGVKVTKRAEIKEEKKLAMIIMT